MPEIELKEYAKSEADNIRAGHGTVGERELMRRWQYDPENPEDVKSFKTLIRRMRSGAHSSGVHLRCLPVGRRGRGLVFPVSEIVKAEIALQAWDEKRLK